jgi:hypothetical protein
LLAKVDVLEQQIKDNSKATKEEIQTIALEQTNSDAVQLKTKEGADVTLKKRKKRKYTDDDDLDRSVKKVYDLLKSKKINTSNNNLKLMGFGPDTVKQFRTRHPETNEEKTKHNEPKPKKTKEPKPIHQVSQTDLDEKHVEPVAVPKPVPKEKPLTLSSVLKPKPVHPVAFGTKIIVPQTGSKQANAEQVRRDEPYYGKDNILLDPNDCKGKIVKNVKHGPKRFRDECHEQPGGQ